MFFTGMLAGPAATVGLIGVFATLGAMIYAMRKKVPHPTEFTIIGWWFRLFGCHCHDRFDLIVDVHELSNLPKNQNVYVFVECGRFDNSSETELSDKLSGTVDLYQRLPIHVRQKDDFVTIAVYAKNPIGSELIGSLEISVPMDLISAGFPRRKTYELSSISFDFRRLILQKNEQNSCKVLLSFFRVEPLPAAFSGTSMSKSKIVQQSIIQSQMDGLDIDPNTLLTMPDDKRLIFFSRVLEGPLARMKSVPAGNPWEILYFRATTTKDGMWVWCFWNSKKDFKEKSPPLGIIPILAMTAVLRNDADASRHQFMLRYQSRTRVKDLYLQRVDRDRDLWVDGLYEFIQMVRDDYQRTSANTLSNPDDKRKKLLSPKRKTLTSPIILPQTIASHKAVPEIESTADTRIPLFSPGKTRLSSSAVVEDMMKWLNDPEKLVESVDDFVRAKNHEDVQVVVADFPSESSPLLKE